MQEIEGVGDIAKKAQQDGKKSFPGGGRGKTENEPDNQKKRKVGGQDHEVLPEK